MGWCYAESTMYVTYMSTTFFSQCKERILTHLYSHGYHILVLLNIVDFNTSFIVFGEIIFKSAGPDLLKTTVIFAQGYHKILL